MPTTRTVIAATGSVIPAVCRPNEHFLDREFHAPSGERIAKPTAKILEQFEAVTGIRERRYVSDDLVTSDIAGQAAAAALDASAFSP